MQFGRGNFLIAKGKKICLWLIKYSFYLFMNSGITALSVSLT